MTAVLSFDEGKNEGATLTMGGHRMQVGEGGYYVEPTIFDNVANDMKIAREEIFGPVLSTLTFSDPDEALKIANDSLHAIDKYTQLKTTWIELRYARAGLRPCLAGTI